MDTYILLARGQTTIMVIKSRDFVSSFYLFEIYNDFRVLTTPIALPSQNLLRVRASYACKLPRDKVFVYNVRKFHCVCMYACVCVRVYACVCVRVYVCAHAAAGMLVVVGASLLI